MEPRKDLNDRIRRFVLWFIGVFFVIIIAICVLIFRKDSTGYPEDEVELFGEFSTYGGKIYASVPSDGDHEMKEVDPSTFRPLSDDPMDRHMAADKNHVYGGNQILKGLNPAKTKSFGHNYYTDGNTTYYCGSITQLNPEINDWSEAWAKIKYALNLSEKPQVWWYPHRLLPSSPLPYRALPQSDQFTPIIANGNKAYYEGLLMPAADATMIAEVDQVYDDGTRRPSLLYLTDGRNVYFKNYRLGLKPNPSMYSTRLGQLSSYYIIDAINGLVYVDTFEFDKANAPYKLISHHDGHIYHALFLSPDGIYFYDTEKKVVRRAGDNILSKGNYKEIAPLVFSDGRDLIYLQQHERWVNVQRGGGRYLSSRSTTLYRLACDHTDTWRRLDSIPSGTIWQNGQNYYYFDEYGSSQLIRRTIYRIPDRSTAESMIRTQPGVEKIREMIKAENLEVVEGVELVEAKTKYESPYRTFRIFALSVLLLLLIFGLGRRYWTRILKDYGLLRKDKANLRD